MNQATTPMVEVSKIDVEDGFNPRTHMAQEGLERLAASLTKTDVVQPLTVRPVAGGRYVVIAGHRRLKAAEMAGIAKVPVHIRDGADALTAALVENHHREDLDPIDTARGLRALGEQMGLSTHKQIAEELAVSGSWVSKHLRLLELPEGVQELIACGEVPVEAEKPLRQVAKVAPRVAECVCELAKRRKVRGREFLDHFDELLVASASARFEDRPTMVNPSGFRLSEAVGEAAEKEQLIELYRKAHSWDESEDPVIRLGAEEVDAARAARCLVEHEVDHGEWVSSVALITDAEMAADLARRAIERLAKQAAERSEQLAGIGAGNGSGAEQSPEEQKDARRAERERAKAKAVKARRFNEELGGNLLSRRGPKSRKQHSLARARALAAVLLADNDGLAASGLRLTTPQLQEVEVKQLKSGQSRERVSYAEREQCAEYLAKRAEKAGSAEEVLEVLGEALVAAIVGDEAELPRSKRIHAPIREEGKVKKILAAEIKEVRPRRR